MTAEIALLNRRALAFAADSAVTISDGSNDKIYNSAEKIFEISRSCPVGLMLYNNMEFMGIPIDVLARNFREYEDAAFDTITQVCDKFLKYLSGIKRTELDEADHLQSVLISEFKDIAREYRLALPKKLREAISKIGYAG